MISFLASLTNFFSVYNCKEVSHYIKYYTNKYIQMYVAIYIHADIYISEPILVPYLSVFVVSACISGLILQFLPVILDIVMPLDEPRPRDLLVTVEYFVDQNKYFYIKIMHEIVYVLVSLTIGGAAFTQLLGFLFHSFGMFQIAR